VADYLDNAFPTRAMESYWDEDGNERSRPMVDEAGNPVHSQEALRIKAETLELLGALPPIVPALDAIISRFGTDAVAEITGRTRRLVTLPDGSQRLDRAPPTSRWPMPMPSWAEPSASSSSPMPAARGRSYHASLDAKNQQRRMHFLLEPGWRADRAIQGLGRTNRTIRRRRRCSVPSPPIAAASGVSSRPSPADQRWLNRILALPIALQNAVFDEFLGLVEARIDAARKAGTFDAGVETLVADKLTIIEERILRGCQWRLDPASDPRSAVGAQVHTACRDREAHRPQDPAAAQWPLFARGAADARSHAPDGRWHAGCQFHAASAWWAKLAHRRRTRREPLGRLRA
jgi:hypothetical protein